ncbi:MAG: threonylcarbamoyl-AMP synthase [Oscillospiraceae bacterium]|nr:threonylcarbamoyl-AMP synthase [Oscillospiraceae bacterium]
MTPEAALLRNGGLVAVPTETVYGLCADASNPEAIRRVFTVKGRDEGKPLPVLVSGPEDAARLCEASPKVLTVIRRFWPGPLTLVLPLKSGVLPPSVTGGLTTVGLRCSAHPLTLALLKEVGTPLVLTSANLSGQPEPTSAEDVTIPVDAVLDGGRSNVGRPSHVLDLSLARPEILRYGALTIGLTGGSGAGKSAVLRRLSELGCHTINADEVYGRLLDNDPDMRDMLFGRFPAIFPARKSLPDRVKLRGLVFHDPEALAALNAITHPFVLREIRRELASLVLREGLTVPVAVEAIALIESGFSKMCGVTLGVTAPEEDRISRIAARDGLTRSDVLLRIKSQPPDSFYRERCTEIIENIGSESELRNKVDTFWEKYSSERGK